MNTVKYLTPVTAKLIRMQNWETLMSLIANESLESLTMENVLERKLQGFRFENSDNISSFENDHPILRYWI